MTFVTCPKCKEECAPLEQNDSFDYSGTHCTGGLGGTHHLPTYYISDCCEEEIDPQLIDFQEPDYSY